MYLVELDELIPKIWVLDSKIASGGSGANAKGQKDVKFFISP